VLTYRCRRGAVVITKQLKGITIKNFRTIIFCIAILCEYY